PDRRDRARGARREPPPLGDLPQQRPGAVDERDAAAGVLCEREAVARQRVPAQDRGRAGVLERAVRERLELGPQYVALLVRELELGDPLGDRQTIEALEALDREQRVMRG